MEEAKQVMNSNNSSSIFTTELFGPKHSSASSSRTSSSSSSGIFGPVFSPPSSTFKIDEGKDYDSNGNNSNGAPRGNWWEGSLYY